MIRFLLASALLVSVSVTESGCNHLYHPLTAISADIAVSRSSGSAGLGRAQTPNFRDTDLSGR
jgi:hypothetical protein